MSCYSKGQTFKTAVFCVCGHRYGKFEFWENYYATDSDASTVRLMINILNSEKVRNKCMRLMFDAPSVRLLNIASHSLIVNRIQVAIGKYVRHGRRIPNCNGTSRGLLGRKFSCHQKTK